MIVYCVIGNVKHYTREKYKEWCFDRSAVEAIRKRLEAQGCANISDRSSGDHNYEFEFDRPRMERGTIRICLTVERANEVVCDGDDREIVIKNLEEIASEVVPRS